MRAALGIAISALCMASSPALAGEGVTHRGDASLQSQDASLVAPLAGHRTAPFDFRLRTAVVSATPSLLDDPEGNVKRRIASSMFDFYPSGSGTGFHLSAGARYFSRVNFMVEAQKMTHGLLYAPNWRTGSSSRAGFKRFTPAVTAGYTGEIAKNMMFGLEAGALLGRANMSAPSALRHPWRGNALEERSGVNPVASLVFGFKF